MRDVIAALSANRRLVTVEREVDPRYELAAMTAALQKQSDKAILFRRVKGSKLPVITNVYGCRARVAQMIGAQGRRFAPRFTKLLESYKGGPALEGKHIERVAGDELIEGRLSDLPVPTCFEKDAGPYLTGAIFLGRNPDTGIANLSFHRAQVVSDEEIRVSLGPTHHLSRYQRIAEARGEALEVVILIGCEPAITLAGCAHLAPEDDELAVAGVLAGRPLQMRLCQGLALDVPASTEIVIAGRILPNVRRPEGPYGEFMGYYVSQAERHVVAIDRVFWKKDACFHSILGGYAEELELLELSLATKIYRRLIELLPGVVDVSCIGQVAHTVVQLRQQYEGHARQAAMLAFGVDQRWSKLCTVVDEDVDIHDLNDVAWAQTVRVAPERDVIVIPGVPGYPRDAGRDHWGRLGLDATVPLGRAQDYERKRIPGAQSIDLRAYGVED